MDRDVFVRYLGGGIGHLEQFPPANNNDGATYEYEEDDEDNSGIGDAYGDGGGEDEDDEDENSDVGEYPDPGKSSDEEVGNVYWFGWARVSRERLVICGGQWDFWC